ncbi:MAG: DUF2157 domain-containing protein [Chloroflexi bacterium]|nr:DUF2157 domain-containing protein [Chloroflexota bacterium]
MDQMLLRWKDEGLLDEAICLRLAEYERGRRGVTAARPVLIELLSYLALVLAIAGVVLLVGVNWEHMTPSARVAVLAVPGLLILAAGRFLFVSGVPGLRRGGSMSWLLSLVLLTSSVGVAGSELGANAETAGLAAGGAALVLASVLWLLNRTDLQVFGLAGASLTLSIVATVYWAASLSDSNILILFGVLMLYQFVGGAALVRLGFMRPKVTAGVLSVLGIAGGASAFSVGLSSKFSDFDAETVGGASFMVFGLWGLVGARLRVLAPELLVGLLSQLGYSFGAVNLAVGIAGEIGHSEATIAGAVLIIAGTTLIALTEVGVCAPRASARVVGAAGLLAGASAASVPDGPVAAEALPLLLAVALATLSLNRRSFLYMAAGVVAAFIGLVVPVARHVEDPTVAALLLIAIGLTMLAVLALLARYQPWSGSLRSGPSTVGHNRLGSA